MNHDGEESSRLRMVERQIKARGVTDPRVLGAMSRVPRHEFIPPQQRASAYEDFPLPIGHGQTISQPYMVALMTAALDLSGNEKVLEIGTGSGYQAAVLSELAREIISLERIPQLAEQASQRLAQLGYLNVLVIIGDGTRGYEQTAPYDGILVTAGAPAAPAPLLEQLAPGGRLVVPVGDRYAQILEIHTRLAGGRIERRTDTPCRFVDLVGEHGWREGTH